MAFMAAIPAALGSMAGGIGTALSVGGAIMGGVSAMQQAKYQAEVAKNNAKVAQDNANRETTATQQRIMQSDNELAALAGEQLATQGASGLSTGGRTQTIKKVKLTAALFSFNTASLDYVVRAAGGIFRVTRFINSKEVEANVITSATKLLPEDPDKRVMPVAAGDWYYTKPVTTIYGLSHLEGETVSILADGNVAAPQKVVNGSITLQHPATKVIVGLPYSCVAKTLPDTTQQAVIEAKRKRTVGLGIRFNETRGLMYGISLKESDLYAVRERTTEPYGVPTKMINGVKYVIPSTEWGEDNQTYFVQNNPLPSTILGLVTDMEIGDDSE